MRNRRVGTVLAAALAAFLTGAAWYSPWVFGEVWMTLRGMEPGAGTVGMTAGEGLGEFARWLIVAAVVSHLLARLRIEHLTGALVFGGWMWIAMYTALAGAVLHEATPWRLYAIHAGDGLVKLLIISGILGARRARSSDASTA